MHIRNPGRFIIPAGVVAAVAIFAAVYYVTVEYVPSSDATTGTTSFSQPTRTVTKPAQTKTVKVKVKVPPRTVTRKGKRVVLSGSTVTRTNNIPVNGPTVTLPPVVLPTTVFRTQTQTVRVPTTVFSTVVTTVTVPITVTCTSPC